MALLTLFSYEISFDLTWFPNSITCKPDTATTFAIKKTYFLEVTFLIQDNEKFFQKLK